MNGEDLCQELASRWGSDKPLSDAALGRHLGLSPSAFAGLKDREITAAQIAALLERYAKAEQERLVSEAVVPIVEFLALKPCLTTQSKS